MPLLLSYAICIPVAKMERSYPIPKLTEYSKYFNMAKLSISSGKNVFVALGVLNATIGFLLIDRMMNCAAVMDKRDNYVYQRLLESGGARKPGEDR